jgi:hypothetical protein
VTRERTMVCFDFNPTCGWRVGVGDAEGGGALFVVELPLVPSRASGPDPGGAAT